MKKRIGLLFVLFLSLFVFSDKVEAIVMYMECDYDEIDNLDSELGSRFDRIVRTTSSSGSYAAFFAKKNRELEYINTQVDDNCWINNTSDISSNCKIGDNATAKKFNLNEKKCPGSVRGEKLGSKLVLAGTKNYVDISEMYKDEYVFYRIYSDKDEENIIVAEGYEISDGRYCFVNRNFNLNWIKNGTYASIDDYHHYSVIEKENYSDYWKVASNFNAQYVYVSEYCSDIDDCSENKSYEEILSSRDDDTRIENLVNGWYSREGDKYSDFSALGDYINDEKFMNSCNNLVEAGESGLIYDFSDGYTASQLLDKLNSVYYLIVDAYNSRPEYTNYFTGDFDVSAYGSAISYVFVNLFGEGVTSINDLLVKKNNDKYSLNSEFLNQMVSDDIEEAVDSIFSSGSTGVAVLEIDDNLDSYTQLFLSAISYFQNNSDKANLTDEEKAKLDDLEEDFAEFATSKNIFVVIECEDLINESLRIKIQSYFNIVKFAVSILLIGFGVLDFMKALFAGDEDAMKKAQQKFLKRILIAVLFFLVPTIVDFMLSLANKVWNYFTPGSCGIFD